MKTVYTFDEVKRKETLEVDKSTGNIKVNGVHLFDINEVIVSYIDSDFVTILFISKKGEEIAAVDVNENSKVNVIGFGITVE